MVVVRKYMSKELSLRWEGFVGKTKSEFITENAAQIYQLLNIEGYSRNFCCAY
jgi:hypothetical protein